MKSSSPLLTALLLTAISHRTSAETTPSTAGASAFATQADKKKEDSTVPIQIKMSVEGRPDLPRGVKLQWNTADENCKHAEGDVPVGVNGLTSIVLPVCKIRILIIIPSFDTKRVEVDMPGNKSKYKDPIRISVKHDGDPQVDW